MKNFYSAIVSAIFENSSQKLKLKQSSGTNRPFRNMLIFSLVSAALAFGSSSTFARELAPPSLKEIKVPSVDFKDNIKDFIEKTDKAILLGKALFWDMQTGSDGQACASCHFQAGADIRVKNQLAPGLNRHGNPDETFQSTASGGEGGPNYTLVRKDFPFHQRANPDDQNSPVVFNTNDVASSQGTFGGEFISGGEFLDDNCDYVVDPIFHVNNIGVRRVEPRHTPTVINAVFNFRNFWDGRANNVFNGVDPFGLRNSNAWVFNKDGSKKKVDLRNSSLASQAVGPPTSDFEMICANRKFAEMGRKLIPRKALLIQKVHREDSVLGSERDNETGLGLKKTYEELIKQAFKKEWWEGTGNFDGEFTQMEANFSLFWGLSLQLYQATLISDQAPYDAFAENKKEPFKLRDGKRDKLTRAEFRGLKVFLGKGKCINCHKGAEFSGAASVLQAENQEGGLVERMRMGDGGIALYDNGFYNIGVTPTTEDIGLGGVDPAGNPLSFTSQFVDGHFVDPIHVDPCTFEVPFDENDCNHVPSNLADERQAVRGAFKVPILRNVELTGPYMHNGSMATLKQVVEFYNRGGNFPNNPELDPDIQQLNLTHREKRDLVAFLKSLTDPRVANEKKPFDHPQIFVTDGHSGDEFMVTSEDGLHADEKRISIPAIGKDGREKEGLPPLQPFLVGSIGDLADPPDPGAANCGDGKPTLLEFEYTGLSCSATTNSQEGQLKCLGDPNGAEPVMLVMTKDPGKFILSPVNESIIVGGRVSIQKADGKELGKDLKFDIRQGNVVLQSLEMKADCSKPINVNDQFGSVKLKLFLPKQP